MSSASPRSAADWKHLKYFLYESQQMFVTTDRSWEHAKVVRPVSPGLAAGDPPSPWDTRLSRDWIWAPTCQSGAQSVTMTQTFLAPGDPSDGTFEFVIGNGRGWPYRSGVYLINGVEIARIVNPDPLKGRPNYASGTLSPRELMAFRYGPNKLTIRVQKTALKKGEHCNTRDRLIGALADLKVSPLLRLAGLCAIPDLRRLVQEPDDHPDGLAARPALIHAPVRDACAAAPLRRLHPQLGPGSALPWPRPLHDHAPCAGQVPLHEHSCSQDVLPVALDRSRASLVVQ